jgi:hypothetical protein
MCAARALARIETENGDQRTGAEIVRKAIHRPADRSSRMLEAEKGDAGAGHAAWRHGLLKKD